jgi:hypothetical protein
MGRFSRHPAPRAVRPRHRMGLAAGSRDRELGILVGARTVQAPDQIARQEGTIRRRAHNKVDLGPVRRRPVECGQNAGERTREFLHAVGDDRQAKARKARRISIGVENEAVALRRQPCDHPFENGAAADLAHRLVAAAHPPRQTTGEQHARSWRKFTRHGRRPCACDGRIPLRQRRGSDRRRCALRPTAR